MERGAGERGVLRVGIFGLMGPDAAFCSSPNRHRGGAAAIDGYDDNAERRDPAALHARAREVVAELRVEQRCDVVICLFHGGTDPADGAEPEDAALAAAVRGTSGCLGLIFRRHAHY